MRPRTALPPPFRWIFYIAWIFRFVRRGCRKSESSKSTEAVRDKYFELLLELVKTKRQAQEESLSKSQA